MCICTCLIARDRAIRPCNLRNSIVLISFSQGGSMIINTKTSNQTRQKGHSLYLFTVLTLALSPLLHCASLPPSWLFYKLSGSVATEPTLSCLNLFYLSAYVSPVPRLASTTPQGFVALLHSSSALLCHRSRLDYFSRFRPRSHRRSHFGVRPWVSTPVPVPVLDPSPSPSPFTSPFVPTTPLPSSFPPLNPYDFPRPSEPITP